jgi:hypothetical protein
MTRCQLSPAFKLGITVSRSEARALAHRRFRGPTRNLHCADFVYKAGLSLRRFIGRLTLVPTSQYSTNLRVHSMRSSHYQATNNWPMARISHAPIHEVATPTTTPSIGKRTNAPTPYFQCSQYFWPYLQPHARQISHVFRIIPSRPSHDHR